MGYGKPPGTPGGQHLRLLRETGGKTQLEVELDAALGIGYLQRLERGKVQRPEPETLHRIVEALGVSFVERRRVFHQFGYLLPVTTPTAAERQWAITVFQREVAQDAFPMYVLDCTHRILAWNDQVPKLFAAVEQGNEVAVMPQLIFDPAYALSTTIVNDEFFTTQIHILQYEQQRCGDAHWFTTFIADMVHYPLFAHHWRKQHQGAAMPSMIRPVAPLQLATPVGRLHFRLMAQPFAHDPRFRVLYCLPADPFTIDQCQAWVCDPMCKRE